MVMDRYGLPAITVSVMGGGGWETVPIPTGYDWDSGMIIQRKGNNFRVLDPTNGKELDPADYAPTPAATYYVSMTGDDGNAGTIDAPLRKIKTALAKAGVVKVICLDQGPYDQDTGWTGYTLLKSAQVIGHANGTIISAHYSGLGWAIDDPGSYPHVYHVTQADAGDWAFDASVLDANGDYTRLTIRASIADVEANAGSIYKNGNELYVRLHDDRAPDSDLRVSVTGTYGNNGRFVPTTNGTYSLYLENLKFYGGVNSFYVRQADNKNLTVLAKNCEFGYASVSDDFSNNGATSYLLNCLAKCGINDGFNYTYYQSNVAHFIEIDCIGRDNGYADRNDNGSTSHNNSRGIRVGCTYSKSAGRNVADITGSQVWMLGCVSHTPNMITDTENDRQACVNYSVGDPTGAVGAELWLDTCVSYGAYYDLQVWALATLYVRKLTTEGNNHINATGTLTTY
jgi:hypothetical protein